MQSAVFELRIAEINQLTNFYPNGLQVIDQLGFIYPVNPVCPCKFLLFGATMARIFE